MFFRSSVVLLAILLCACSKEARNIGPALPQTPPLTDDDPRISAYQGNVYQVSQGGRYFAWYGCSRCHGEQSKGVLNLADDRWAAGSGFQQVFRAIGDRHGRLDFGRRVPVEQLWQLTAYVRDLPRHFHEKRRRLERDTRAEPQGSAWTGPQ